MIFSNKIGFLCHIVVQISTFQLMLQLRVTIIVHCKLHQQIQHKVHWMPIARLQRLIRQYFLKITRETCHIVLIIFKDWLQLSHNIKKIHTVCGGNSLTIFSVSIVAVLKLPSLFATRLFRTYHNKSHTMKALVILSHSWSPFLPLTCLYENKELLWVPVRSSGVFSQEKTSHSSLFQHRCSYRDLCPNF